MKSLVELTGKESNWHVVEDLIKNAVNAYEILPKDDKAAEKALLELQQSVSSLMGAITYETGGIFIDNGWLRLLGSGHERLTRTIAGWNLGRSYDGAGETPGYLMVADDVLGGLFAVNGTELGEDVGNIYYLAPDTIEWEPLEINFHEFLAFCFAGDLNELYGEFRWEGWANDIKALNGDQAFLMTPPLWVHEPENIGERQRHALPMEEVFDILLEANNLLTDEDFGVEDENGCGCEDDDCGCDGNDCGCGGK